MSNQQPPPGFGDEPGPDPSRAQPPVEPPEAGGPQRYENAPPPPPPPGDTYGTNPYGGAYGAVDPLSGMPPLASLPRRLLARIIDMLIIGIPISLLMGIFSDGYGFDASNGRTYLHQVVYILVYFVYEGLMLSSRGQTLGKMAMKVRVGMLENGSVPAGSPGWSRAAVYSLPQLAPCLGFLFWLVNVLFCTWDKPYRQCLHDKAAKTVVVAAR